MQITTTFRFSLHPDDRSQSPEAHAGAHEKGRKQESSTVSAEASDKNQASTDRKAHPSQHEAAEGETAMDTDVGLEAAVEDEDDEEVDVELEREDDDHHEIEAEDDEGDDFEDEHEDEHEDEDEEMMMRYDDEDMSDDDFIHLLEEEIHDQPDSGSESAPTVYPRSAYRGHCNKETVKDITFAGRADQYVISGSDDGNWFMWDKHTSEIKGIWHGDSSVVNVMAMHPDLPVFAISALMIPSDLCTGHCDALPSSSKAPAASEEEEDDLEAGDENSASRTIRRGASQTSKDLVRSFKWQTDCRTKTTSAHATSVNFSETLSHQPQAFSGVCNIQHYSASTWKTILIVKWKVIVSSCNHRFRYSINECLVQK